MVNYKAYLSEKPLRLPIPSVSVWAPVFPNYTYRPNLYKSLRAWANARATFKSRHDFFGSFGLVFATGACQLARKKYRPIFPAPPSCCGLTNEKTACCISGAPLSPISMMASQTLLHQRPLLSQHGLTLQLLSIVSGKTCGFMAELHWM